MVVAAAPRPSRFGSTFIRDYIFDGCRHNMYVWHDGSSCTHYGLSGWQAADLRDYFADESAQLEVLVVLDVTESQFFKF